jgi:hypothetical protein
MEPKLFQIAGFFLYKKKYSAFMAIDKIKIMGAVLELLAKQLILPIWPSFEVNGLFTMVAPNWLPGFSFFQLS